MLTHLSIKNYALIDDLNVSFRRGFTTITGETGAGKSIFLDGLSLVLGKRADMSSLRDKDRKCIIEAMFDINSYGLKTFFGEHELDYDHHTILRREIHPGGKSRAFVNDAPITLDILSQLGTRLIDVHSQHQTLQLADPNFQLKIIDALADNFKLLTTYREQLEDYKITSIDLSQLIEDQKNAIKEQDYNRFLLKELTEAPLKVGIQEELEDQYEQLSNVETLLEQLAVGNTLLNEEQHGIITMLSELKQLAAKLAVFGKRYALLNDRIQSVYIELDDIAGDLGALRENVEANPELLEAVSAKLQVLHDLYKKHGVTEISELLQLQEELTNKVAATEHLDIAIAEKQRLLLGCEKALEETAATLSKRRGTVLPGLKKQLEELLGSLGMPNATFKFELQPTSNYYDLGKDRLQLLFSANRGGGFGELKKIASGGELSRIMLAIKSILSKYEQLPTMMFDEIDTGVSGEISNRMGDIMQEMSKTMQIFSITHLPQVASKGDQHFKVYKEDDGAVTHTKMKELQPDERIVELAEMLGGKSLSDSALAHARQLLN